MNSIEQAQRDVHTALKGYLEEGELCVGWCLVMDVVGPNETRSLAHRFGGGVDGSETPTVWTARGMLATSVDVAADQIRSSSQDAD